MLIRKTHLTGDNIPSSEITPLNVFRTQRPESGMARRDFISRAATLAAGSAAASLLPGDAFAGEPLKTVPGKFSASDPQTPMVKATNYNNFYEFGVPKDQPAKNAHTLHTRPWTVAITGLVKKEQTVNIDDLINYRPLESRVYRHRCVEAWSMVIPWDGYSLSEFVNFCNPLPSAKYVQFITLYDRKQMPEAGNNYDWPYSEGLRMDEAMNPLALLTFGCYGEVLPNQNGAPIRVVSPWKYGFKNGKSIVKFHFTDKQPHTLWNEISPEEYGFYANVNPQVDHPRWTQAHERRLDSSAFPRTIPTQMFNGYGDQVASLYAGMDLKKNY
jgi:methionine sulfoxide reductase catalytic subunit